MSEDQTIPISVGLLASIQAFLHGTQNPFAIALANQMEKEAKKKLGTGSTDGDTDNSNV